MPAIFWKIPRCRLYNVLPKADMFLFAASIETLNSTSAARLFNIEIVKKSNFVRNMRSYHVCEGSVYPAVPAALPSYSG